MNGSRFHVVTRLRIAAWFALYALSVASRDAATYLSGFSGYAPLRFIEGQQWRFYFDGKSWSFETEHTPPMEVIAEARFGPVYVFVCGYMGHCVYVADAADKADEAFGDDASQEAERPDAVCYACSEESSTLQLCFDSDLNHCNKRVCGRCLYCPKCAAMHYREEF